MPHRGKTNEPAYVSYVADYLAELRGVDREALAEQTSDNFTRLFLQ
jgi:Mg-dependent DNase